MYGLGNHDRQAAAKTPRSLLLAALGFCLALRLRFRCSLGCRIRGLKLMIIAGLHERICWGVSRSIVNRRDDSLLRVCSSIESSRYLWLLVRGVGGLRDQGFDKELVSRYIVVPLPGESSRSGLALSSTLISIGLTPPYNPPPRPRVNPNNPLYYTP